MRKRLTVADRVPEPGDIVYSGNGFQYNIYEVQCDSSQIRFKTRTWYDWRVMNPKWRYSSRKDNGPVYIEDN